MQHKSLRKALKGVNFVAKWLNLYPTTVFKISTLTRNCWVWFVVFPVVRQESCVRVEVGWEERQEPLGGSTRRISTARCRRWWITFHLSLGPLTPPPSCGGWTCRMALTLWLWVKPVGDGLSPTSLWDGHLEGLSLADAAAVISATTGVLGGWGRGFYSATGMNNSTSIS